MNFGITLSSPAVPLGLCSAGDLLALADAVEAYPVLDSVWCGDALFVNHRLDALTLLAGVAGRTGRRLDHLFNGAWMRTIRSPHERSEMREQQPGCRFAHPGYQLDRGTRSGETCMQTLGLGFTWEQLSPGQRFRTLNRTVTETDLVLFTGVTG